MARTLYLATDRDGGDGMRAWLALREAGLKFDEYVVDLSHGRREANLSRLGRISPSATVPILVDSGHVIYDAVAIMEYAHDVGSMSLLPLNAQRRAEARSMLAWQRTALCFPGPGTKDRVTDLEQREASHLCHAWQAALDASGGPYLYGGVSLADLGLVPRLAALLQREPRLDAFPRIIDWMDRLLRRASVREWMARASRAEPAGITGGSGASWLAMPASRPLPKEP